MLTGNHLYIPRWVVMISGSIQNIYMYKQDYFVK